MSKKQKKFNLHVNPNSNIDPLLKEFKPRTKNQFNYARTIIESDVTFCTGPAGSGKSSVAVGLAINALYNNKVGRIVVARPVVEATYGPKTVIGALPGGLREKIDPYVMPIYEELVGYLGKSRCERYIKDGIIELLPLELMRGITRNNSFLILDEAQNATFKQITLFITRLGIQSKCIVNGDINQSDLPYDLRGGLTKYINLLANTEGVGISQLDGSDNQRHPTVSRILAKVEENND